MYCYTNINMKCEACKKSNVQVELKVLGNTTYRLCMNCNELINRYALSPQLYNNLIKSGHKKTEFLLHSDFYDDNGNPLQPA